jgi:hypothetical protein
MRFLQSVAILPFAYYLALIVLAGLIVEASLKLDTGRRVILLAVYATIAFWYLAEITLYPEDYAFFPAPILNYGYAQIILFLLGCRILFPLFSRMATPRRQAALIRPNFSAVRVVSILVPIWIFLTIVGIVRMKGDVLAALFPIGSRASEEGSMWGREGVGGQLDFLVSGAGYLHLFVCSMFGLLLFYEKKALGRSVLLILIAISWPYFFFLGARNQLLAVATPLFVGYLLRSTDRPFVKGTVVAAALLGIQLAMVAIIEYRNVGFQEIFVSDAFQTDADEESRHLGMNMGQELLYIDAFSSEGLINASWGTDYLAEAANGIPRGVWQGKPLIGYEYARLRGFGNDLTGGVWATVSTGIIGQGVLNFGPFIGPIFASFLFSVYGAILYRWWCQRESLLRFALFLVGVGAIFNLGRDFTLLVLWPVVFGYILVRIWEWFGREKGMPQREPMFATQRPIKNA